MGVRSDVQNDKWGSPQVCHNTLMWYGRTHVAKDTITAMSSRITFLLASRALAVRLLVLELVRRASALLLQVTVLLCWDVGTISWVFEPWGEVFSKLMAYCPFLRCFSLSAVPIPVLWSGVFVFIFLNVYFCFTLVGVKFELWRVEVGQSSS